MTYVLTTPREAEELLARLFQAGSKVRLEAREDKAFSGGGWFSLGEIELDRGDGEHKHVLASVRRGAFEWSVPKLEAATTQLTQLLGVAPKASMPSKVRRALDAIAAISLRVGLQHPRFDPQALAEMPFRRSTTVVADTSGAIQGGLDFVARHLHPAARIKVPAIVQMEIVNFADRFLSGRRAAKVRSPDLLIDHLLSQGGQRVLLRLELQADTEIERTFLLGDPLRNAFQRDNDPELNELNLSVTMRAYVDRLILESARQHLAQANPGHRVQLLTSDQGLARMALGEGIAPLFFLSVVGGDFFGKRLTGASLDPFTGRLREISFAAIVWEFATAFGCMRVTGEDDKVNMTVAAFGEGLSWSPYQSHADLLWCDTTAVPAWSALGLLPGVGDKSRERTKLPKGAKGKAKQAASSSSGQKKYTPASKTPAPKRMGLPRFNVARMFDLVDRLDNDQVLSDDQVMQVVEAKSKDGIEEYRRFLTSAGLATVAAGDWGATAATQRAAIALRQEDTQTLRKLLGSAPAFEKFETRLADLARGEALEPKEFERSLTTYRTLGEVTEVCAPVFGKGLFATLNRPTTKEFAPIALARFGELDRGDGLVATGAWLEALVQKDGIHPEVARARLNDASAQGFLRRTTEGSTTERRFDNHIVHVLRTKDNRPTIAEVRLYRGDYLIPGKSSTSLRVEGVAQ